MSSDEYDRLFKQAYKWLRYDFARDLTYQDWEDQAQEAIIRLSSSVVRGLFDPKKGSVDAYFKTIVRRLSIEEFRRRQRQVRSAAGAQEASDRAEDIDDDAIDELIT